MQPTHKPLLVMGAGSWGTALAMLAHRHGNPVRWWTFDEAQAASVNAAGENTPYLPELPLPDDLRLSTDLPALLEGVDDVLIVVPSFAFTSTLELLKSLRPTGLRLAWGTKGLDRETHALLHDVVSSVYGDTPMAVISGPSFAREVALEYPTAVSLASNDTDFADSLVSRFHGTSFRLYVNSDLTGVELCGVVKNVLAIGVGMCDGLGFGANTRCALITRGLAEMERLCNALGGQSQTAMSLAGVGDTILTCTDNQSRNRRFGLALGQGKSIDETKDSIGQAIEGYFNAQQLYDLARQYGVETPIIDCIYRVLYAGAPVAEQVDALMGRGAKSERAS